MYYSQGLTQNQVADQLGISRSTVVRLLDDGRRRNEVTFWIEQGIDRCAQLGAELERALGIAKAIVVPRAGDPESTARSVGHALGRYLSQAIGDAATVGVGWGRTLSASLQSFRPKTRRDCRVVSLLGGTVDPVSVNPVEYSWRLATAAGAQCYLFPAPLVVDSPQTKQALIERCGLSRLFEIANKLDLAVVSVGDIGAANTSLSSRLIGEQVSTELAEAGCVADIMCNFLDAEGRDVDHPIAGRVMSVGLEALERCPHVVIASGGGQRGPAILAAVRRTRCHTLITDEAAAEAILKRRAESA